MNQAMTPLSQALGNNALVPRRELKRLMKRSNVPGLIHLFWWLLLLMFTGSLIWLATGHVWLLIPAMFIHGVVMVHHFALQHECTHFTAFRSRRLCRWLAAYCGFVLVIPPLFFRYEHCDHHTYTNLHGKDPEMIPLPKNMWAYLWYLSSIPYWSSQFGGMFRRATGRLTKDELKFVPRSEIKAVILESRLMILGYLIILTLVFTLEWWAPLLYWWLPIILGEPVMRFIRMTEHAGRPTVADMTRNTRTNICSSFWCFLAWNMNYHAEHHYAASVPFYRLKVLHEKIKDRVYVEQKGYLHAHVDIVQRVRAQS